MDSSRSHPTRPPRTNSSTASSSHRGRGRGRASRPSSRPSTAVPSSRDSADSLASSVSSLSVSSSAEFPRAHFPQTQTHSNTSSAPNPRQARVAAHQRLINALEQGESVILSEIASSHKGDWTFIPNQPKQENSKRNNPTARKQAAADRWKIPSSGSSADPVHSQVTCDQCQKRGIVGTRYKCRRCWDYDLCTACFNSGEHEQHQFIKIERPDQLVESMHLVYPPMVKRNPKDRRNNVKYSFFPLQAFQLPSHSLLHSLAMQNKHKILQSLLEKHPTINVNIVDSCGLSPLMYAAGNGAVEAINLLINAGAKLDQVDELGLSALHFAVQSRSLAAVKAIAEAAKLKDQNKSGASDDADSIGLWLTILNLAEDRGVTALHIAAYHTESSIDLIQFLVSEGGDLASLDSSSQRPFHYAYEVFTREAQKRTDITAAVKRGRSELLLVADIQREAKAGTPSNQNDNSPAAVEARVKAALADLPPLDPLIEALGILIGDLDALEDVWVHLEHPQTRDVAIKKFGPKAVIDHFKYDDLSEDSPHAEVLLSVARYIRRFNCDLKEILTLDTLKNLLHLLAVDGSNSAVKHWSILFLRCTDAEFFTPERMKLFANSLLVTFRIMIFAHSPNLEYSISFHRAFFPTLMRLWLQFPDRIPRAQLAHWFDPVWPLLGHSLVDVDLNVEDTDRFAVMLHSLFTIMQVFPELDIPEVDPSWAKFTFTQAQEMFQFQSSEEKMEESASLELFPAGWEFIGASAHELAWPDQPASEEDTAPDSDTSADDSEDYDYWERRRASARKTFWAEEEKKLPSFSSSVALEKSSAAKLQSFLDAPANPKFIEFLQHRFKTIQHLMEGDDSYVSDFRFLFQVPGAIDAAKKMKFIVSGLKKKRAQYLTILLNRIGADDETVSEAQARLIQEQINEEAGASDYDDEEQEEDGSEEEDGEEEEDEEGSGSCSEADSAPRGRGRPQPQSRPQANRVQQQPRSVSTPAQAPRAGSGPVPQSVHPSSPSKPAKVPTNFDARKSLIDSALFQILSASPASLTSEFSVRFIGEEGVGQGPIREGLTAIVQALFHPDTKLFEPTPNGSAFHFRRDIGAQFAPLQMLELAGRVVALCLIHEVQTGISLSHAIASMLTGEPIHLKELKEYDAQIYRSLVYIQQNPESSEQFFSATRIVEGKSTEIDLMPSGAQIPVNKQNVSLFIKLFTAEKIFGGLEMAANSFFHGFTTLLPRSSLSTFHASELQALIKGPGCWNVDDLESHCGYYGGYTTDSPVIRWFWKFVRTLDEIGQRRLLSFWSGNPNPPVAGFKSPSDDESDSFGIERIELHEALNKSADDLKKEKGKKHHHESHQIAVLPKASTCSYTLKLPPYRSFEQLKRAMAIALEYAHEGFAEA